MNIRILTIFFFLMGASVYAQKDLIVTQAGQEIRCKILEESSMRFTYAYINEKGKVLKTEIFKTLISNYKYNYYPEDVLPSEKIFNQPMKIAVAVKDEPRKIKKSQSVNEAKAEALAEEKVKSPKNNDFKPEAVLTKKEKQNKKTEKKTSDEDSIEVVAINEDDSQKKVKEDLSSGEKIEPKVAEKADVAVKAEIPEEIQKTEFKNYLKYRIGLKGGLGNIMEENLNKTKYGLFKEKLLRGWVYGVDAAMFLNDYVGVGVAYNSYHSSSKATNLDYLFNIEEGSRTYDEVFTKVNHKFVGPTLLFRVPLDFKTFIVACASPGRIFYTEQGTLEALGYSESYKYKGSTWGGAASLGIDFLIGDDNFGRDVILSFELGYNYGKISKLNYGGTFGVQPLATPINLQRLDFSIGLRFNRFPRYLK